MAKNETKKPWNYSLKRTKTRENIINTLATSSRPLSAMEILELTSKEESSSWPSTIYRNLEILVEHDIVLKTKFHEEETAYYEINQHKHRHYAYCVECKKIIDLENCPFENFHPKFQENGFQLLGHNLEIYGLCKECLDEKSKGNSSE
ncbi:MAG: transcriptional repressor [Vallitaleaceae bacterium]|nr:transcriptional repressor [Vallitaleaceae bacterium]